MENNLEKEKQNQKEDDELLFIEKNHKGLKVFIVITIILLILGGAGTFYYIKIYNNPMLVVGNILKNIKEELNFRETDNIETFKFSGELDVDLGFEDAELQSVANIINNVKLQYILSSNENDYSALELFSKYKNEKLLNAKMILEMKEELGYLYLEDLYDKYLHFDLEETDDTIILDVNYEVITNGIFKALSKSINEDDFERSEDKTDINGSIEKVYRNSLIINRGNYHRIMKTFITELRNNDEFINEVNKLNKEVDFKEELNTMLEDIDKEIFEDIIKINFYTKRGLNQDLLKIEIVQNTEDGDTNIAITSTNDNEVTIDVLDTNDNNLTIVVKINNDTNFLINLNLENGKNYIKAHLNCSFQELDKLDKINTRPSININRLTEVDRNKIMTNLSKNETLIKLINDITNVFAPTM